MQKLIITSAIIILSLSAMAQDRKVAVFDPVGNVSNSIKEIIREEISSIIVNTGGYTVLERQLINKVLEENRFQAGGLVDDAQVSEMGKRMGANYVFVSSITPLGNANYYISCKMIDVQTARVEKQRTAQSSRSETDLIGVVQKTMGGMFSETENVLRFLQTDRANDEKVAIFDPAGSVDNSYKEVIREEISSIIVNTGGYTVLERQLIDRVLEENRFQSGGLVDDAQVSEMGKRMGANLVFVSSITAMSGNNFYISCKLIDVQTARIERQRTGQTQRGANEMIDVVKKMVGEMFISEQRVQPPRQTTTVSASATKPVVTTSGMLIANGKTIYRDNRKLSKNEVRGVMANTNALPLYNKGVSRNRNGNILLISGVGLSAGAAFVFLKEPFEERYSYTGWDGNIYYGYDGKNQKIAYILGATGAAMAITSITLKVTSSSFVKKSVTMYNSLKTTSYMDWKFDVTGNGACLTIQF